MVSSVPFWAVPISMGMQPIRSPKASDRMMHFMGPSNISENAAYPFTRNLSLVLGQ